MSAIRKWTAAVTVAATLSAGVATVSQPAMAFEGYHRVHHVHHYHRRSSFGSSAAWGAAGFVGGMLLASAIAAANQPPPQPYGRAVNIHTGESVEAVGIPGGRIVTFRDGNGRVKERQVRRNRGRSWASSTDPRTGITVTSVSNGNGTRTVTRTDGQGRVLSQDVIH